MDLNCFSVSAKKFVAINYNLLNLVFQNIYEMGEIINQI